LISHPFLHAGAEQIYAKFFQVLYAKLTSVFESAGSFTLMSPRGGRKDEVVIEKVASASRVENQHAKIEVLEEESGEENEKKPVHLPKGIEEELTFDNDQNIS
jgi:hypothetical protein